jgi:hypothetical protein
MWLKPSSSRRAITATTRPELLSCRARSTARTPYFKALSGEPPRTRRGDRRARWDMVLKPQCRTSNPFVRDASSGPGSPHRSWFRWSPSRPRRWGRAGAGRVAKSLVGRLPSTTTVSSWCWDAGPELRLAGCCAKRLKKIADVSGWARDGVRTGFVSTQSTVPRGRRDPARSVTAGTQRVPGANYAGARPCRRA